MKNDGIYVQKWMLTFNSDDLGQKIFITFNEIERMKFTKTEKGQKLFIEWSQKKKLILPLQKIIIIDTWEKKLGKNKRKADDEFVQSTGYEDHRDKTDFIKVVSKTLIVFRQMAVEYPNLKDDALTFRFLWETWTVWGHNDKLIDGVLQQERKQILNTRTAFRLKTIKKEMEQFCNSNEIDWAKPDFRNTCDNCEGTRPNSNDWKRYTCGQSYEDFHEKIKETKTVKCSTCWKNVMISNKARFGKTFVMLPTSKGRDADVKEVYVENFSKCSSTKDFYSLPKKPLKDLEVLRKLVCEKIKQIGLQNKFSIAWIVNLVIIEIIFCDNMLDMNHNDMLSLREFGNKKVGIVEDVVVGLDTHLKKLIVLWKWCIEKDDSKQHDILTTMFQSEKNLIPLLNSAVVTICQLFQSEEKRIFGVILLELIAAQDDGKYSYLIDAWYKKEFSTKQKIHEARKNFLSVYKKDYYIKDHFDDDREKGINSLARLIFTKYGLQPRKL